LYPATDRQQTGNFVDGNKQHVQGNMLPGNSGNMLPDVNALPVSHNFLAPGKIRPGGDI